jgi:hypothetical protein
MMRSLRALKYLIVFSIAITGFHLEVSGQIEKPAAQSKQPFSERLVFGGSLGLSFGSYSSLVDISPVIGYAITNDFMAGIGLTYKYYQYNKYYMNLSDGSLSNLKMNIYGGSLWSRYFLTRTEIPVIEHLFLHVEYEPLFIAHDYKFNQNGNFVNPFGMRFSKEREHITLNGVFVGGGLRQPVGKRAFMYLEVLWNLNEELYSIYSNPRIRIGIAAGF